jgi:hypothetical protein
MYAAVTLSFVISLLLTRFFWEQSAAGRANSRELYYLEICKRSVFFGLAVVIVAILLVLSRYPLHLSRNIQVSSLCFSALFLSEAARLVVDSLTKIPSRPVDWVESAFALICLLGWTVLLRRESPKTPPQIRYSSPREDHLLQQLNSLNELMARAARR